MCVRVRVVSQEYSEKRTGFLSETTKPAPADYLAMREEGERAYSRGARETQARQATQPSVIGSCGSSLATGSLCAIFGTRWQCPIDRPLQDFNAEEKETDRPISFRLPLFATGTKALVGHLEHLVIAEVAARRRSRRTINDIEQRAERVDRDTWRTIVHLWMRQRLLVTRDSVPKYFRELGERREGWRSDEPRRTRINYQAWTRLHRWNPLELAFAWEETRACRGEETSGIVWNPSPTPTKPRFWKKLKHTKRSTFLWFLSSEKSFRIVHLTKYKGINQRRRSRFQFNWK